MKKPFPTKMIFVFFENDNAYYSSMYIYIGYKHKSHIHSRKIIFKQKLKFYFYFRWALLLFPSIFS
jgi:hypothetical protein